MTRHACFALVTIGTLWARVPDTASAQCLTTRGSLVAGDTHELVLTQRGQQAEASTRGRGLQLSVNERNASGVPAVRVVDQRNRTFHARFSSDDGTVLKSNLGPGEYTATLVVARFGWPSNDTVFEPVAGCQPIEFAVREVPAGRWLPNPQMFLEVQTHIGAGAEVFAGRYGLAAVVNQPWADWTRRPDARFELRVAGTRGVFATGWRLDGQANGYRSSLSASGAVELPPFLRHPMWVLVETHVAEWDGMKGTAADLLGTLSIRLRFDLRRVWR